MEDEKDEPETTVEELVELFTKEDCSSQKVLVKALLNNDQRQELVNFLKKNKDVFD